LATPNYGYEKRQKELAKKRKKEDKLKSKAQRKTGEGESDQSVDEDGVAQDQTTKPGVASTPPAAS
jgi:hypothetical protein